MQISIMMSVWCQNLWDELILKNEIKKLKTMYWENTIFNVFTYDIKDIFCNIENTNYFEYFPIWIKNPKNIFKNIKNYFNFIKIIKRSDLVVFWWWWIFFDNEVWSFKNPLNQWLFRANIINLLKKELLIYWVSLDIKDRKNDLKIKNIFWKAKKIFVRDENSFLYLKWLDINSTIIKDPVFYDNNDYIEDKSSMIDKVWVSDFNINFLKNINLKNKTIWIAFRKWYLNDEENNIKTIINYLISQNCKITLLPHSFHKIDKIANDLLFLNDFVSSWITITNNMKETYEVYNNKKIDFCLSMRLHSMILCESYNIDYIKIIYAKKWEF